MKILGIDEAGRGPLLGPLVMAGILVDASKVENLKNIGVKDSKLLTKEKREELYDKILDIVEDHKIIQLSPKEIDKAVLSDSSNLNFLEADTTIKIINALKPDKAIIDAPSNNLKAYKEYIESKLKTKTELVVEHKADLNYVESGAASILAKVTRDNEIKKLEKKYGTIGSGYPSDPITVEFLEKNYKKYPEVFRKSWSSYQNMIDKKAQSTLSAFTKKKENPKVKLLLDKGYKKITPKNSSIDTLLKGPNTVTFYKNGRILVQGKDKEVTEKLLGK